MAVIYEDEYLVAVNKPPFVVCRASNFAPWLLIHRLDKETSGVLLLAKTEDSRAQFQRLFRNREIRKVYLGLAIGWDLGHLEVGVTAVRGFLSLRRLDRFRVLLEGRLRRRDSRTRKFAVGEEGRPSQTVVRWLCSFRYHGQELSLLEIQPWTGRTHQIRVHLKEAGWPLVGDSLYAPKRLNESLGLIDRQFLHAKAVSFRHPFKGVVLRLEASLPSDLRLVLRRIRRP